MWISVSYTFLTEAGSLDVSPCMHTFRIPHMILSHIKVRGSLVYSMDVVPVLF